MRHVGLSGAAITSGALVLLLAGAAPAGAGAAADCKSDGTPLGDATTKICKDLEKTRKNVEKGVKDLQQKISGKKTTPKSGSKSGSKPGSKSGAKSGTRNGSGGSSARSNGGYGGYAGNGVSPASINTRTVARPGDVSLPVIENTAPAPSVEAPQVAPEPEVNLPAAQKAVPVRPVANSSADAPRPLGPDPESLLVVAGLLLAGATLGGNVGLAVRLHRKRLH
ncbi:hypothetical protein D5H75_06125 [Bailinhaonella thermotolerans]|uniref:Gram-positive cocci surface proteins LPxTG domain-containing protein n=2 Tax=Bailinhaonella thermotolerans TaxID=1070861 RepID=A0A3A4AV19_9ACTN|nr:hypothetical protein D5H75_06125 [Bailinhaonella thermotolerans]